ncbi:ELMD3 protein, partial [Brachypteracias leptosomus]|nr:ELMD3 protein [Brachypteracias leptosomus]
ISFKEALQFFQTAQLTQCREKAQAAGGGRGLAALLRCLCGPPRLQPQLRGERELALAMAHCALDDNEGVHMRILQTIYKQLTRSRLGCPRYGEHWEELGFQGRAEERPGGETSAQGHPHPCPEAAQGLHHEPLLLQHFPFCIMSINITRMVLQALREERLSRECNRRQEVIPVLNQLYAAAFLRLYRLWRGQHKTVSDSSVLLKELEFSTKKRPKQLLKSLEVYISQ